MVQAAQLAQGAKYEEALVLFTRAYERVNEPRLLINIGRCHYRLGRPKQALEFYEQFQQLLPDAEPELMSRLAQFRIEAKTAIVTESERRPSGDAVASLPQASDDMPEPPPAGEIPGGRGFFRSRPGWRLGLGAALAGAGLGLTVTGAAILAADGTCVTPSPSDSSLCTATVLPDGRYVADVRDGITPGVGLLLPGLLLLGGGVVLIALPPTRKPGPTVAVSAHGLHGRF